MLPAYTDIKSKILCARLPAVPQVLLKILDACGGNQLDTDALAEMISHDVGLTATVLRVASSPSYAPALREPNLQRAVSVIGIDMVKTLFVTASIRQTFNDALVAQTETLSRHWHHSIGTALAARLLAPLFHYPNIEEAYLAGLLHDVGRLALLAAVPDDYAASFSAPDDLALCAREERTLALTHADAGAALIEDWQLDSFLADAALYHHEPIQYLEDAHPLVRIVVMADLIANGTDRDQELLQASELTSLALQEIRAIQASVRESRDRIAGTYDIAPENEIGKRPVSDKETSRATAMVKDGLQDKVCDLALVSKTCEQLVDHLEYASCAQAIVRVSGILFYLTQSFMLLADAASNALTPIALTERQRRLMGLSVAMGGSDPIAASVATDEPAFLFAEQGQSIQVQQLLRMFRTDALVLIPFSGRGVLVCATPAAQALQLKARSSTLREFGSQAGSALRRIDRKKMQADTDIGGLYRVEAQRVAHEVNTPLAILKNTLAVLERKLGSGNGLVDMGVLNEEIDRVGALVNNFAAFEPAKNEPTCMLQAELVRCAKLWAESGLMENGVTIAVTPRQSDTCIAVDTHRLRQIVLNLVKNAVEAMPSGGRIHLTHLGTVNRNGRLHAEMAVTDNGPGIPAPLFDKLFVSGSTTKNGTHRGLGLNIVRELLVQAGGDIVCSSDDAGTRFRLFLPLADVAAPLLKTTTPT